MKTYKFLAEVADRRTTEYKELDEQLEKLAAKFGKNSKEVNDFFETEHLINLGWTCTDPDAGQYGRQISEKVYNFKEKDFEGDIIEMTIDLSEYDNDSMYHHVCAYYGYQDFEEMLTTEDGRWIIAECIFESLSGNY